METEVGGFWSAFRENSAKAKANGAREVPSEERVPLEELEDSDTDADEEGSSECEPEAGELTEMAATCPLWDALLPMDVAGLKTKQVSHTCLRPYPGASQARSHPMP